MTALAQRQAVNKIDFMSENKPSEEQIFLMRILNGEITLKSNEEVLSNLRKRLKIDK